MSLEPVLASLIAAATAPSIIAQSYADVSVHPPHAEVLLKLSDTYARFNPTHPEFADALSLFANILAKERSVQSLFMRCALAIAASDIQQASALLEETRVALDDLDPQHNLPYRQLLYNVSAFIDAIREVHIPT